MSEAYTVLHKAQGYESIGKDLSAAVDTTGRLWCAWHSMPATGGDDTMARWWDGVETSPHQHISAESGVNYNPVILCDGETSWVFWSGKRTRWCILGSRFTDGTWHEEFEPAESHPDALSTHSPSAAAGPGGKELWLAYLRDDGRKTTVCARPFDDQWEPEFHVSTDGLNYRPRMAAGPEGKAWLAWDRYVDRRYTVQVAQWDGTKWLPEQSLRQGRDRELLTDITIDAEGRPWVAWVKLVDVRDDAGVIDQKASICVAHLEGATWRIDEDVALLYQGLLAREGAWGYLGRRRRPMIRADRQGGVHLFYEIKETESESTGKAVGYLLMRHWNGQSWSDTYEVCREDYGYQVAQPGELADNRALIVARRGWEEGESEIVARRVNLLDLKPAALDDASEWDRWRHCALPEPVALPQPLYTSVVRENTYQIYWGDLHCHGYFSSDAEGELDELLFYARDRAALDFCAVAENDNYVNRPLTDSEWEVTQRENLRLTQSGRFVAFSAYEWTYRANGEPNHRIVIFRDAAQRILRHCDPNVHGMQGLMDGLDGHDAFVFAHHPKWELTDSDLERNVEVCSSWGTYIDKADTVRQHLAKGRMFGFLGCSDTHRRVPGLGGALTAVLAENLSRDAIFEALMARRCYATTGSRIFIDFSIEGCTMGEELAAHRPPHIHAHVVGTAPLLTVDLIRNGEVVQSVPGRGERLTLSLRDHDIPDGRNYYYVRVVQKGNDEQYPANLAVARGTRAWSSPIWVNKT